MHPTTRVDRAAATLGVAVAAAFAVTVVGSNIPGPILPLYEDGLGMSPFVLSALFATYFGALISMFLVMNRSPLGRVPHVVLPVAMLVGICGDVALWVGSTSIPMLFLGRIFTGVCVGMSTGAAAALAVLARGEAGRTLAATGAIGGSLIGLVASAVVAEVFPNPTVTIYRVHAVALVVFLAILLLAMWLNRTRIAAMNVPSGRPVVRDEVDRRPTSGRVEKTAAYGLGAAGWTVGGIAVGVLPAALQDGLDSDLLVMGVLGAVALLVVASIAPYVGRVLGRTVSAPASLVLLVCGSIVLVGGIVSETLLFVVLGCLLWGVGQGFAYARGLTLLTRGMAPVQQGRATSLYACTSYGFAALMILLSGALSSLAGYTVGSSVAVAVFALFCCGVFVLGRGRWQVSENSSPAPSLVSEH